MGQNENNDIVIKPQPKGFRASFYVSKNQRERVQKLARRVINKHGEQSRQTCSNIMQLLSKLVFSVNTCKELLNAMFKNYDKGKELYNAEIKRAIKTGLIEIKATPKEEAKDEAQEVCPGEGHHGQEVQSGDKEKTSQEEGKALAHGVESEEVEKEKSDTVSTGGDD